MERVAIYCRVSTQMQERDGVSLDAQLAIAERFCEGRGFKLVKHYVDTMSGQSDARPGLAQLEADLERGGVFEHLLVYRLDRLWRNSAAFHALLSRLEVAGVGLASLTEPFDATTPIGRFLLTVLVGAAELEVGVTSARVADSIRYRAEQGRIIANGRTPIGYTYRKAYTDDAGVRHPGRMEVHDDEAQLVRWIYAAYLEAGSIGGVLERLRFAGLTCRGKVFYQSTIQTILRRSDYMGEREALGTQTVRRGGKIVRINRPKAERVRTKGFPNIIEEDQWRQVQAKLDGNLAASPRAVAAYGQHPWTGIIRCGGCGSQLGRVTRGRGTKRPITWRSFADYKCRSRFTTSGTVCQAPASIPEDFLSLVVAPRLLDALTPIALAGRKRGAAAKAKQPDVIAVKILDVQRRRERVQDMYEAGDLSRDKYRERIERLDAELARLQESLTATPAEPRAMRPAMVTGLQDAWERAAESPRDRRAILEALVEGGTLAGRKLVLRLVPYDHPGWPDVWEIEIPDLRTAAGRALFTRR